MEAIGNNMRGSGLEEVFEIVCGKKTVEHVMTGKAYMRAIRGHTLVTSACGKYSGNIHFAAFHCHRQTPASCHALDNLCLTSVNSPSSKCSAKLQLAVHKRGSPSWYRASRAARSIIVQPRAVDCHGAGLQVVPETHSSDRLCASVVFCIPCKYELPASRLSKVIGWQTRLKLYTTPLRGWSNTAPIIVQYIRTSENTAKIHNFLIYAKGIGETPNWLWR